MPKTGKQSAECDGCEKVIRGTAHIFICLPCTKYFCHSCYMKHALDVHQGKFWWMLEEDEDEEARTDRDTTEGSREPVF
jgi:hypothetical protein